MRPLAGRGLAGPIAGSLVACLAAGMPASTEAVGPSAEPPALRPLAARALAPDSGPASGAVARASAAPEPRLRRAVLAGPLPPALLARLRGQTSDLDWTLDVVPRAPGFDVLAWSRSIDAEAVLVIEQLGSAWDVSLIGAARERRLVRRVEVSDPSSALETVAVIVRGLLSSLEVGAPITLETAAPVANARVLAAPDGAGDGLGIFLALGLEATHAGAVLPAGRGRAGVVFADAWTLALGFASGPARDLDDGRTTLSLARHSTAIEAGYRLRLAPSWTLGGELGAGVAGFWRSVVITDRSLVATPSRLVPSFLATASVRATWWPNAGPLGVELAAGLDVAPAAPVLAYQLGDQVVERTPVGVVEPRVALSVVIEAR